MDNNIMDWGDVIESDGQEHKVLPEGDYDFTITKFERGRFPGSPKIPPCNKAILTLNVNGVTIKTDLILYKTLEWKLAAFFRSIGQKKHGEKLTMDWNKVEGANGRARISIRKYERGGQTYEINDVAEWLDPVEQTGFTETKDKGPWGDV